ncbi:hypothetical protein B0H67DRAFT_598148 [Lasiosphaeris hirsuta]|uniref:Actin-like ATPase domain-containing protein n=1 Tax=Lasiosphaeris hirsuta TaxID=260670 RepID=A0AA40E1L4_9PEZI|nr:hypothetical protein B0H67DRAFT_598148 [Lasiosphaeris hirsuta]
MPAEAPGKRLIVGIDYGTTFSGISYAMSTTTKPEDVNFVSGWGSRNRRYQHELQVPSRIAYGETTEWGYGIQPGTTAYCWTKLLLDRHTEITGFDDTEILQKFEGPGLLRVPRGMTAQKVVRDYLAELYKFLMKTLEQKLSHSILAVTPIEFWITLPALWSVRADNATKDAAVEAGFGSRRGDSIHLIREPEAAAIASIRSMNSRGSHPLIKPGNGVLVCDCGGGTVDLASYQIQTVYPRLSLKQACVSKGGKCGSTTIDRAFYKLMCDRFGSAFTELDSSKTGPNSKFMLDFEAIKRSFGESEYEQINRLTLKMDRAEDSDYYSADDYEVILTDDELEALFDPTVEKIISLLEQQVRATRAEGSLRVSLTWPKLVVLVGGFGESLYLFRKLQSWCQAGNIELIAPNKSWEAICLGATLRGLEGNIVKEKRSRFHIGVEIAQTFRLGDDDEFSYIDAWTGEKMTRGFAQWIVNRGETIATGMTKQTGELQRNFTKYDTRKWSVSIYQSELAVAPERIHDAGVKQIGNATADLTAVDFSIFEAKHTYNSLFPSVGEQVWRAELVFELVLDDDLGYMYFRATCHGMVIGKTTLQFGDNEII